MDIAENVDAQGWAHLPEELLQIVVLSLDLATCPSTFATIQLVCKSFRKQFESDEIYEQLFDANFGGPEYEGRSSFNSAMSVIKPLTPIQKFDHAVMYGWPLLVRKLFSAGLLDPTLSLRAPVFKDLCFRDRHLVLDELLCIKPAKDWVVAHEGRTFLHSACYYNAERTVATLIKHGADIFSLEKSYQQSPLHVAIQSRYAPRVGFTPHAICEMLLQDGNFNTPELKKQYLLLGDRDGETPMSLAHAYSRHNNQAKARLEFLKQVYEELGIETNT